MTELNVKNASVKIDTTDKAEISVGDILDDLGAWQIKRLALVFFICLPGCTHVFAMIFATVSVDFWCESSGKSNETINQCVEGCAKYEFDRSEFHDSIIMQYGLVCEWQYLETVAKLCLFGGYAVGTFVAGMISDHFGRKTAITISCQLLFCSGIIVTIMPNIAGFTILWFIVGIAAISVYTVAFVWCSEMVGRNWKVTISLGLSLAFPISKLLVTFAAYFIRDYKIIYQGFSSLHLFTPMLMILIPESPRWLLSRKNPESQAEACQILAEVAKSKGQNFDLALFKDESTSNDGKPAEAVDHFSLIFTNAKLRIRGFVMLYCWLTTSFVVYSVNLNMKSLTGSLFLNLTLAALLSIPGRLLGYILMTRFSIRKLPFMGSLLIGAIGCGLCPLLDNNVPWQSTILSGLVLLSSTSLSCTFAIIWLYTAELYPTGIRNFGVGLSSFMARIGGAGSTFVVYLAAVHTSVPFFVFSGMCFVAAILAFLLPETGHQPLPTSIKEIEDRDK